MTAARCSSGHVFDLVDAKYIGAQDAGGCEWLDLHICPRCSTTVSGALHVDACKCHGCGHLILGSEDDIKVVREVGDGPWQVLCVGCAREVMPPYRPEEWRIRRVKVQQLGELRAQGG